jgi:hypothetical protein
MSSQTAKSGAEPAVSRNTRGTAGTSRTRSFLSRSNPDQPRLEATTSRRA